MQAKYINPFLQAAVNLFKIHLGVEITNGAPYINADSQNLNEISAIIGLAGDTIGAVVLSFTRDTAGGPWTLSWRASGRCTGSASGSK